MRLEDEIVKNFFILTLLFFYDYSFCFFYMSNKMFSFNGFFDVV